MVPQSLGHDGVENVGYRAIKPEHTRRTAEAEPGPHHLPAADHELAGAENTMWLVVPSSPSASAEVCTSKSRTAGMPAAVAAGPPL